MRKAKDHSPVDIMIFANIITAFAAVPFFILHPPVLSPMNISIILFLGIFQIGVAAALFSYGISKVTSVQAMLIATIEPVLNPVWVLIVIGEVPLTTTIIGGSIIVIAVLFSSLANRQGVKVTDKKMKAACTLGAQKTPPKRTGLQF
jgi:drug/metabolite transporter (DMT)-like permease